MSLYCIIVNSIILTINVVVFFLMRKAICYIMLGVMASCADVVWHRYHYLDRWLFLNRDLRVRDREIHGWAYEAIKGGLGALWRDSKAGGPGWPRLARWWAFTWSWWPLWWPPVGGGVLSRNSDL